MRHLAFMAVVLTALSGCSAVGVIDSSDPQVKVAQAEQLQQQGRIARAKQLLDGAYGIAQKQGDDVVLAQVYRGYGIFYLDGGADDIVLMAPGHTRAATREDLARALGYFRQSAALLEKNKAYDWLPNVYFLMAKASYAMEDKAGACKALDDSRQAYRQGVVADPSRKVTLMSGVGSFEEGIARAKTELGCSPT